MHKVKEQFLFFHYQ